MTAGAALLARLKAVGVDYIFANSGTDFPPLIEALADTFGRLPTLPEAFAIPHEHTAMGMAPFAPGHTYFMRSDHPQLERPRCHPLRYPQTIFRPANCGSNL